MDQRKLNRSNKITFIKLRPLQIRVSDVATFDSEA
jgi:hypothetical protein